MANLILQAVQDFSQYAVQNEIWLSLGLSGFFALPSLAKYYHPIPYPPQVNDRFGLYAAVTDNITSILEPSTETIKITVTDASKTKTTTTTETYTKTATSERRVPTTATITESRISMSYIPTTLTVIGPSTVTEKNEVDHYITMTEPRETTTTTQTTTATTILVQTTIETAFVDPETKRMIYTSILRYIPWWSVIPLLFFVAILIHSVIRQHQQLRMLSRRPWYERCIAEGKADKLAAANARVREATAKKEAYAFQQKAMQQAIEHETILQERSTQHAEALEDHKNFFENRSNKFEWLRDTCNTFFKHESSKINEDVMDARYMELLQISWGNERKQLQQEEVIKAQKRWKQYEDDNDELRRRIKTLTDKLSGINTGDLSAYTKGLELLVEQETARLKKLEAENRDQQNRNNSMNLELKDRGTQVQSQKKRINRLEEQLAVEMKRKGYAV